jgi:hypothetical protein
MLAACVFDPAAWSTRLTLFAPVAHSPTGLLGVNSGGQRATAQAAAVLLLHEGAEIPGRLAVLGGIHFALDHLLRILGRHLAAAEDVDHTPDRRIRNTALPRFSRCLRQPEDAQDRVSRLGGLGGILRGTRQRAEQEQCSEQVWNSGAHDRLLESSPAK